MLHNAEIFFPVVHQQNSSLDRPNVEVPRSQAMGHTHSHTHTHTDAHTDRHTHTLTHARTPLNE